MKSNSKIHMYYTEGSQRARDYVGFNKQLVALPGCDKGVERGSASVACDRIACNMPKTLSKYDFTGQNHPENGVKAILITDTFIPLFSTVIYILFETKRLSSMKLSATMS